MSDWSSRPRMTPMAGRRKPTYSWCQWCETLHRTHRHVHGAETCPDPRNADAAAGRRLELFGAPHIRIPKGPTPTINVGGPGGLRF